MTQREITPNTSSIRNTQNPYLERVMRTIVGMVSLLVIVVIVSNLWGVITDSRSDLAQAHNGGLTRIEADLQDVLMVYVNDLLSLRNDPDLVAYLDGTRNEAAASTRAAEIITQDADTYLAVEYIRLDDTGQAFIAFERENNNGLASDVIVPEITTPYIPVPQAEAAFAAVSTGEVTRPILSDFYVDPTTNRAKLDAFVPIIRAGQPDLIIRMEINATSLRNVVRLALGTQIDAADGRRVLLFEGDRNVIADSGAVGDTYLDNLAAADGNISSSDTYTQIIGVEGLLAGTSQPIGDLPTSLTVYSAQAVSYDLLPNLGWSLVVTDNVLQYYASTIQAIALMVLLVVTIGIGVIIFSRRALTPILGSMYEADTILQTAAESRTVTVPSEGRHDTFVNATRRLTIRLDKLSQDLESEQARRSRDMQVAGRISRATATLSDLDELANRSINLICNELGFYHAQIFLLDASQTQAILRYSRGEAGQLLIAQGHQLAVGSDTVIGTVTAEARPVIVNDTQAANTDEAHAYNPLLADTRAEMGLPLIIGSEVIGALDIQSQRPSAFDGEDIPTYQLLADQLAVAIYNAQLREESEQRLQRSLQQSRDYTRETWQETGNMLGLASEYGLGVQEAKLSSEIRIRGEVIGSLEADLPDGMAFSEAEQQIMESVANRVSLALENVRLFQETQVSLNETSTLYALSSQLNAADDLEDVLQAVIDSIAPDASGGQVWLFDETSYGQDPQWAQITGDIANTPRTERVSLLGRRYQVANYPFLQGLSGETASLFPDIREGVIIRDELRDLFLSINGIALAIIPLNMRGAWRGFLSLTFADVTPFSPQDERIYQALISQAGVTVDNRLLQLQTENQLARQEKLYAASRIINTSQDMADLVYAVVATSSDPALDYWLSMLEGTTDSEGWGNIARIVAQSENGSVKQANETHPVFIPENSPMREREPEILVDPGDAIEDVPVPVQWMRDLGYRFMAIFPLFSDNNPIALFTIVNKDMYNLSQEDYEVYRALTGQMSTQIQVKNLLQRTEDTLGEIRRLYAAARAISGSRDIGGIYDAVARHLTMPFQMDTRLEEKGYSFTITVLLAYPNPSIHAPQLAYDYQWHNDSSLGFPVETGTIISQEDAPFGSLIQENEDVIIFYETLDDMPDDFPILREILTVHDATSATVAPLWSRQRWLGVLIISTDTPALLDESYRRFITSLADQMAIGVENRTLLAETEFERQRLQNILETLPVGVMLLDPDTLQPVFANAQTEEVLGQPLIMDEPFTAERYHIYRTGTNLFYPNDELPMYIAKTEQRRVPPADDVAIITEFDRTDLVITAVPIFDPSGDSRAIVVALQDYTTLRSMENTMQENLRETVLLYETQGALNQSANLDELLDALLMQMMLQQPADMFIILQQKTGVELASSMVAEHLNVGMLGPILTDQLVNIDDTARDTNLPDTTRDALSAVDARSVLVLPLQVRTRSEPMGWMIITDDAPEAFTFDHERTMNSIAEMASQAIDNIYLIDSTREALNETESLYNANTVLSRADDVEHVYSLIADLMEQFQADMTAGFLMIDGTPRLMFQHNLEASITDGVDVREIATLTLPNPDVVNIRDIDPGNDTPDALEQAFQASRDIRTVAAVNLRVQGELGGRLILGFNTLRQFDDSDRRYLGTIADSASVVLDNKLLLDQVQSALSETSVLYQASKNLIESSEPDEILGVLTQHVIGRHVDHVFIGLLNRQTWDTADAAVNIVASWQQSIDLDLNTIDLTPSEFPAWRVLSTPQVLVIDDVQDEDNNLSFLERMGIEILETRSLAILPLRVPGRSIGIIWIGSREPHKYSERDVRVFQAFAEQTSLSLEAKRLLDQTEQRAKQLQTSAVISQSVSQILDLDVLLPQVVNLIQQQFGYDHVQVFLMDEDNDWALLRASTGEAGQKLLAFEHKLRRGSDSVIGQVTEFGNPTIALDTADADVVHQPNPLLPLTRSEMALPMVVKGEIVGALDVQSNSPNAFTDEDIQVLSTLASQIAVAIDNARLYEDAEQSAEDMTFLFDITREAAAAPTLREALQYVAQSVRESIGGDVVAIYLPQAYEDYYGNRKLMIELEVAAYDAEMLSIGETPSVEIGDAENMIGIVTNTRQPQIIREVDREARYTPLSTDTHAALLMPISSREQPVGLIVMEDRRANAFGADMLKLLQTMAGSVAAIIENTLLVEELQSTNEQLSEVNRLKSQFLASMSHELRTPLNSIIGFSRVMLKGIDGPLTEMQEQDLSTIYNSGNHLLRLINDILDQAKIEANQLNLSFGYFEVKPMVESVKSIAVGLLKDKEEVQLIVDVAPNLPKAYGDEMRSRQILLNVVTNAIKFTQEGEVNVRVYAIEGDEAPMILMDVTDTGIGIAEPDIPTIFEQFRQVDSSLTRTVGGTGLGLPISKSLAELQGGDLTVVSEVNVGSTFTVTIPTVPGADEALERALAEQREQEKPVNMTQKIDPNQSGLISRDAIEAAKRKALENVPVSLNGDGSDSTDEFNKLDTQEFQTQRAKKGNQRVDPNVTANIPLLTQKRDVILVEDDKNMVDQFRRILQREGFDVTTADFPAFAEAMIGQLRPSLVILDVNFADGKGWELLQNLKERDDTFDIPVIVTTMDSDSQRAYQLGAHTFIERPFLPDDLMEAVLEAEKESQRERVLIIDDQPEAIRLLTQLLEEHSDFKIYSAQSGDEGISLVARRRPNLIILDLRMPDKDGFAVLDELRGNPETANIPVLVVTGELDLNSNEQALLEDIRVLPKTDISQAEYDLFIDNVRTYLDANNRR